MKTPDQSSFVHQSDSNLADIRREPTASKYGWHIISLSPLLAFLIIFTIVPIVSVLVMSFYFVEWTEGKSVWTFVNFQNYLDLPGNRFYVPGIKNTIIFAVFAVSAQMIIGFFLAWLVSRVKRGRVVFITIFLLPILIPPIVIGSIWKLMYGFDFGVINQITGLFGILPRDWLGSQDLALMSVIIVDVWHWTPFVFLLLLAAIETLPQDVYEAAKVDGISEWQQLRYITLPLLMPAILVTMIFRMIVAFKVFDEIYLLTSGGPGTATEVLSFSIYRTFFNEDRVGVGSAMSIGALLLITILTIVSLAVARRRTEWKNA